jgi:hypothetical protein
MKEMDWPFHTNKIWVDPEDMWIYQDPEPKANTLILP